MSPELPKVYVVTPTYRRPLQYAELTRVYQSLYPVRQLIHWIIVDEFESSFPNHLVHLEKFLKDLNVSKTILRSGRKRKGTKKIGNPRGVASRRKALAHIRRNNLTGLVYFADDDNTYDSEVFAQIQQTRKLSAWPVGCLTQVALGSPVVQDGRVIQFHDGWLGGRKFPFDFAGFAVNISLIHKYPAANIPWIVAYEETKFLTSLRLIPERTEPLGDGCTRVMTYHTRTRPTPRRLMSRHNELSKRLQTTNLNDLWKSLVARSR